MKTKTTLNELYSFPGFRANSRLKGLFGDSQSRIIVLKRRQKKQFALYAAEATESIMIPGFTVSVILKQVECGSIWNLNTGVYSAGAVKP